MTTGNDLTRSERLALVRAAERMRLGFEVPRVKAGDLDLGGVIYAGGGEIDVAPEWWLPGAGGSETDRRLARVKRSGRGNSAAFALCESFARTYGEPALHVFRGPYMDLERSERLDDHPLAQGAGLLRVPNRPAQMTMTAIQRALAAAKLVGGNFYLVKARTGGGTVQTNTTGAVARLWPVWPFRMWPEVYDRTDPRGSNGWIDYYAYDVGRGKPVEIPPENVLHFKNGMRDDNPRLGIGVVEEFAEEVAIDIETALLTRAVYTNLGFPGMVFSPDASGTGTTAGAYAGGIGKDDREQIKASIMAKTTGARRGEPIVLSRPTRFEQFKVDLEQYNLEHVWTHVETRISAVIGWPAILAGLQAGLEAATYANVASLRRFATENAAVPTWEDDSETWTLSLRDDVGLRPDEWIAYDYRSVRALQEDRATVAKEALEAFSGNAITVGQYHERIGAALPAGVDPALRQADIEASAQLRNLLGPALGKGMGAWIIDGSVVRPEPLRLMASGVKAADLWQPDGGEPLDAEDLDEGDPTDEDLDAAVDEAERRIAELDPDLAGILGATVPKAAGAPAVKADPRGFGWVWHPDTQRFRWPDSNHAVPEKRVHRLRERLIEDSKGNLRGLTQGYLDGKFDLAEWQRKMRDEYRSQHLALRALSVGGRTQMKAGDLGSVGGMMKRENRYLAGFARDIADGKLTEAQILARSEQYAGASMRRTYAAGRQVSHRGAGFDQKRRSTRSGRPCETCSAEAAMDWVGIDEPGWVLGDTECKSSDVCEIEFRKASTEGEG